jgi:xanthine/CO dehydrogenase XdhC/CoxF family maturation factor
MKELNDIISAYDVAVAAGKKTALATVVHVEGSSYRRPGARMLVTEDGMLTGTISGGCLEGDALRKALAAINENRNRLVTYDSTDDDDAAFGVQLGCNGIVHILFEPLNDLQKNHPLQLLKTVQSQRNNTALVTLFSLDKKSEQTGTVLSVANKEVFQNTDVTEDLKQSIVSDTLTALDNHQSIIRNYETISALIQIIRPSVSLIIFGAGNDAIPLVSIGKLAGWNVTVVDGRKTHATPKRFPEADAIIVSRGEKALEQLTIDKLTVVVLMTHNYNYDKEVFRQVVKSDCLYAGLLGPKKRTQRMIDELSREGTIISDNEMEKVYSPVGLDIGAETAEEIALSIATEIKAVLASRSAQSLRDRNDPIHNREEETTL